MEGTFTNTQRLVQKHEKAVDPPDDARSDLWFTWHLGLLLKKLYRDSSSDRDWAIRNPLWNYHPEPSEIARWRIKDEPSEYKVLKEINGYTWADGKAWLFAPSGLVDGPLPTHYEPYESPVRNFVYKQQSNPVAKVWKLPDNPYHKVADPKYPIVVSTYRLTEHHLTGSMSRWLPWHWGWQGRARGDVVNNLSALVADPNVSILMLGLACSVEAIDEMQHSYRFDMTGFPEGTCTNKDALLPGAARRIRLAFEENRIDFGGLLPHITAGEHGFVESAARDLQLDPGLLWMLARNAIKPALHAWGRQLAPLAGGVKWDKGCCFICGAEATLGELRENRQVMHLRCGQCGADWQFRRLQCIYCGNEDHGTLSCLYSEDQREKMRIEACDMCGRYVKVITSFSPTPPEMLPVEDLATLHLDYIAREHGYERGRGRND